VIALVTSRLSTLSPTASLISLAVNPAAASNVVPSKTTSRS
jgi:hypothetical protein